MGLGVISGPLSVEEATWEPCSPPPLFVCTPTSPAEPHFCAQHIAHSAGQRSGLPPALLTRKAGGLLEEPQRLISPPDIGKQIVPLPTREAGHLVSRGSQGSARCKQYSSHLGVGTLKSHPGIAPHVKQFAQQERGPEKRTEQPVSAMVPAPQGSSWMVPRGAGPDAGRGQRG